MPTYTMHQMELFARFCTTAEIVHANFCEWQESFKDWLQDSYMQKLFTE